MKIEKARIGKGWWPIGIGLLLIVFGGLINSTGYPSGGAGFVGFGAGLVGVGVLSRLFHLIELRLMDVQRAANQTDAEKITRFVG